MGTRHQLTLEYERFDSFSDLEIDDRELLEAARAALEGAYAPYSNFLVGAAVRAVTGDVVTGSNQETANYKESCAEKVTLDTASAQGLRLSGGIRKIAIVGRPRDGESSEVITPCGQCRQDIKEWQDIGDEPVELLMGSTTGKVLRVVGIEMLLPFAFGPKDLGNTLEQLRT